MWYSRWSGRRLRARSREFLALPNCAVEVLVHARRHRLVVIIGNVFAYISEYKKRSPQMRQCHWSRAKMYGRHSELFGSSLGLGILIISRRRGRSRSAVRGTCSMTSSEAHGNGVIVQICALLILGLPSWVDPTATLAAAKGRLIPCTVPGSNIPGPCQPALSGRNSPIVSRSAAMVRASGVKFATATRVHHE
jgi:hypothetical protein